MATKKPATRSSIDQVAEPNEDDEQEQTVDERPQYKLTEQAYIEDRLLEPGALIRYEGTPGHHMKPHNAQAKALCKKLWPDGRPEYVDPIQSMAIVGKTEASESQKMMTAMAEQTAAMTNLANAMTASIQPQKKAA